MERLWLGSPYLLHVSEIAFVLLSKFKLCNNFLYKGFQILSNLVEKHSLLVHHSQTWISLQRKGYQSRYVTCSVFADTAACRNWDFPQNEYIPHGSIPSVIRNDPGWRWDWINPGMLLHQMIPHSSASHAHWNWCHLIFSLMSFLAWAFKYSFFIYWFASGINQTELVK